MIELVTQALRAEGYTEAITPELPLTGRLGVLDSMGLVAVLSQLELSVQNKYAKPVVLASERAFAKHDNPFATVGSLVNYLQELVDRG